METLLKGPTSPIDQSASPSTMSGLMDMLTASLLFSFIGVCVLESQVPAQSAALYRCLFAALSLAPYCFYRGDLSRETLRGKSLALMAVGGFLMAVTWWLLFEAYAITSISVATLMFNTQPFFTLIVGSFVFREALTIRNILWTILAFGGIVLISGVDSLDLGNSIYYTGVLYAIGAAMLYGVTSLISKQIKAIKPHVQVLVQVTIAGLVLAFVHDFNQPFPTGEALGWMVALGVLCTSGGYIALYGAFRKLPVSQLAVLSFVYPMLTVIVDYLIYGTVLSPAQLAGIALVVVSSLGISKKRAGEAAPAALPAVGVLPTPWCRDYRKIEGLGPVSYQTIPGREQGSRVGLIFREHRQFLQLLAIHRPVTPRKHPTMITGKPADHEDAFLATKGADESGKS